MLKGRRIFICLFFTVILLSVSGCKSEPKQLIRIGYITADQLHSPAIMIMKEKKLLEAAGYAVEWTEYMAGSLAVQELHADQLDFAVCGFVPIMVGHAQNVKLAILAGSNEEGSSLVVNNEITSIEDLDGKRIATPGLGSIQDALLSHLVKTHNIRINRTVMEVANMPLFLQRNEIDGYIAWAPHPAKAVELKYGHELLSSHNLSPSHQCCVLVTKESTLQDDLETVCKLLEIYLDAYKWFLENQNESIKLLAKNTGMTETVISHAIPTVKYNYPPFCNTESMYNMALDLVEAGRMTLNEEEIAPFIDSLYNPELLGEIAAKIGL